jgi:SAM-dependent methyltransferase
VTITDDYAKVADLYDHVGPYRDRTDVQFFVDAARESGGPVLEVGCGTGRVLIPTARAGIEITGLDLSAQMLAICREKLEREAQDVQACAQLVRDDMRTFALGRTFKLVTVPFRPFQHLVTVADQRACLEGIHRHLTADGRLILDLFNPSLEALTRHEGGQEYGEEPEFSTPDGRRVVRKHRMVNHDRVNQVNDVELVYYVTHPDGSRERIVHAFQMRYLFRFEVEHLLTTCGFVVEQLYGGYAKQPFGVLYPGELIFVARKAV